jgi:phage head maturation protease
LHNPHFPIVEGGGNVIEGYICLYDKVDNLGEVVKKGRFKILKHVPIASIPVVFNFDYMKPAGRLIDIKDDSMGVYVKIELAENKEASGLSFGFIRDGDDIVLYQVSVKT